MCVSLPWAALRRIFALFLFIVQFRATYAVVSSQRWRVVGRSSSTSWVVHRLKFFSDTGCSVEISSIPWNGRKGGERYDGNAFAGPDLVRKPAGNPAVAFESK